MAEAVVTDQAPAQPDRPMRAPARLAGIVFSPRKAYAEVARRPRWFVPLLLVCVVVGGVNFAFLSTRVGQTAYFNQSMDVLQSFGVNVTDAMYDRMEAQLQYAPYTTAAAQAVTFPIFSLILSGIFFAVFVAILGAEGTFTQVFAVVVHSEMIVVVQQLFIVPLNYARHAMNSPTTLAAFVPMLDEHSYPVRLLGGLDLFAIWSMVNLSIGLAVLFKRRTGPIATTILVIYAVIVAIVAAIRS